MSVRDFAGWDITTACQEASKHGLMGLVSEQSITTSTTASTISGGVIPACRHYQAGADPAWSPLAGGLLGGALAKAEAGRRGSENFQKEVEQNRVKLEQYEALCREIGESPANVALAWLLHNRPSPHPSSAHALLSSWKTPSTLPN